MNRIFGELPLDFWVIQRVSERTIECKEKYVITCLKSQIKNAALIN
jgi:hypothetical protein